MQWSRGPWQAGPALRAEAIPITGFAGCRHRAWPVEFGKEETEQPGPIANPLEIPPNVFLPFKV